MTNKFCSKFISQLIVHYKPQSLSRQCIFTSRNLKAAQSMTEKIEYPNVRRDESVVEDYHGTKIADPYRWLEDPDSDETKAFVEAENKLTKQFLDKYPHGERVNKALTKMWDYPKHGLPHKKGKKYYYGFNTGLQNQSVVYTLDSLDGEAKVFLDPNKLSDDGTTAVSSKKWSKDGSICAVSLSHSGSDWVEIKFIDCETGEWLKDDLKKAKFTSLEFTRDNKGFFYNSYPDAADDHAGSETNSNINQKLVYHVMGTEQSQDVVVAEFPDQPKWMSGVEMSDCGNYLLLGIREGCEHVNRLYYFDMKNVGSEGFTGLISFVKLIDNFDAEYEYITNEGTLFTFKTNLKAPRGKLITIDFTKPEPEHWSTVVPEHETDVLDDVACVNGDKLMMFYTHDVKTEMFVYDLTTGEQKYKFPLPVGTVAGMTGRKEDTAIFYYFTSFVTPGQIFRCDMTGSTYESVLYKQNQPQGFDSSDFVSEQVFFESKDGTKIPMFINYKKGMKQDGKNPVLLYGYGGFNISITPGYSNTKAFFMKHLNGIFAVANIRGGGEYGETWHKAGSVLNKQNCFDDFCAAAEYLTKENYTNASKIIINGGSNGGLLVGACVNQRPDLFGAAIADVGVMDMLRFHKFTIGHAWTTDYGCSDNKEHFEYQVKYSPVHSVNIPIIGQYPSLLLTTADHDDRVVPLHSLKYIATVQHVVGNSDKQTNPLLIQVEEKAGHGAGKPTSKIIQEQTDNMAFMALSVGLEWSD